MSTRFSSGKNAIALCDKCGFTYPLNILKKYYIMGKQINSKVCPECWDPDAPQNWVGILGGQKAANDPQALREARPDNQRLQSCSNFAFNPVATLVMYTEINNANVSGYVSVTPAFRPVPPVMGPVDI